MKESYDSEYDIWYVEWGNIKGKPGTYFASVELPNGIVLHLDKNKNIIGIEVFDAKRRLHDKSKNTNG